MSSYGFETEIARRIVATVSRGGYRSVHRGRVHGVVFAVAIGLVLNVSGFASFVAMAAPDSASATVMNSPFNIGDPFKARGLGDALRIQADVVASEAGTAVVEFGDDLAYLGDLTDTDADGMIDEDAANGFNQDLGFLSVNGNPVTDTTGWSQSAHSISLPVSVGTTIVLFEVQIVRTRAPLQGSWAFSGGDSVTEQIAVSVWSGITASSDALSTSSLSYLTATTQVSFTIQGFNGFGKHIWFVDEVGGQHSVGFPSDGQPYALKTFYMWRVLIAVNNYYSYPWVDALVMDRFGAEFGVQCDGVDANHPAALPDDFDVAGCPIEPWGFVDVSSWSGDVSIYTNGKSLKVLLDWTNIDAPAFTGNWWETWAGVEFLIFTDLNPSGKQEFTSPGCTDINSGSVLKWYDPYTGNRLSAETGGIGICAER
ncbi:MAG TPA: hypothetical protein VJN63_02295 [Thermoplasmata archaeon]|nr:hypothetical protein [Thermoplasmata archaeon]